MHQSVLVGGGGAHGLEVGHSERDQATVQAEDDASERDGFCAEGGKGVGEGAVGAEIAGTEGKVHEDTVGYGGVKGCWKGRKRGD